MSPNASVPPPAMWAQRNDRILLTYNVECDKPTIEFSPKSVSFKGNCLPENNMHEGVINLYAEIIPDKCVIVNKGRCILLELVKAAVNTPFWPRLTTENVKHHWLKVDFGKMEDENDSENEEMGGGGGGGGGGSRLNIEDMMRHMGGLDGEKDRPGFEDSESDSDDDALPDLEG